MSNRVLPAGLGRLAFTVLLRHTYNYIAKVTFTAHIRMSFIAVDYKEAD